MIIYKRISMNATELQYADVVNMYMKNFWITKINDKTAMTYSTILYLSPSSRYKIPCGITELIQINFINKLYAHPIVFKLSINIKWHSIDLDYVNGIKTLAYIPHIRTVCDSCNNEIEQGGTRWRIEEHNHDLCEMCYTAEHFAPYNKNQYMLMCIPNINFTDWIEFGKSYNNKFYVNCNPDSSEYCNIGILRYPSIDETWTFTNTYKNVHHLITDIRKWINSTPLHNSHDSCIKASEEFLESHYYTTNYTYRYILEHRNVLNPDAVAHRFKTIKDCKFAHVILNGHLNYISDEDLLKLIEKDMEKTDRGKLFSDDTVRTAELALISTMVYEESYYNDFGS
jgi:hypothetical protein